LPRRPSRKGPRSEGEQAALSEDQLAPAEAQAEDGEPAGGGERLIATEDIPGDATGDAGVQKIKVAHDPQKPSAREVEEHRVTHYPFCRWCRECLLGKALGEHHRSSSQVRDIPIIGMDYFFITSEKGLMNKSELAKILGAEGATKEELEAAIEDGRKGGAILKCLIIRDSATKVIWAHTVPMKGLDEERHILSVICEDLKWLGHTRMIIRCDNEPALKALAEEAILAAKARIGTLEGISREAPEPYDSQSNGMTEIGVRMVRAQFRTLRACLERRLGVELPVSHPIMS
jgi:hypothetical protein